MELSKASMCECFVVFKLKQGKVMQGHATLRNSESCNCYAESCNAMQSHATSRKVMQHHARSCNVMQSYVIMQASHTTELDQLCSPVVTFRLYSAFFRRLGRDGCLQQLVCTSSQPPEIAWIQAKCCDRRAKLIKLGCATCLAWYHNLHDVAWPCMTLHDLVECCMTLRSIAWLCVTIAWLCVA